MATPVNMFFNAGSSITCIYKKRADLASVDLTDIMVVHKRRVEEETNRADLEAELRVRTVIIGPDGAPKLCSNGECPRPCQSTTFVGFLGGYRPDGTILLKSAHVYGYCGDPTCDQALRESRFI